MGASAPGRHQITEERARIPECSGSVATGGTVLRSEKLGYPRLAGCCEKSLLVLMREQMPILVPLSIQPPASSRGQPEFRVTRSSAFARRLGLREGLFPKKFRIQSSQKSSFTEMQLLSLSALVGLPSNMSNWRRLEQSAMPDGQPSLGQMATSAALSIFGGELTQRLLPPSH